MKKSMKTAEAYGALEEIRKQIERSFMKHERNGVYMMDPAEIELIDPEDPNELQKHNALFGMLNKLDEIQRTLVYLAKPIVGCGPLRKNHSGRYELNGMELTSGAQIEVLDFDAEWDDCAKWVTTTLEHDGEDYYIVFNRKRPEGVMARYR